MKRQYNSKISAVLQGLLIVSAIMITGCGKAEQVQFTSAMSELGPLPSEEESSSEGGISEENRNQETEAETTDSGLCYVHICGAVRNPGVYAVASGSREYEVIEQAGGFTSEASTDNRNQAAVVADGEQIKVLTVAEAKEAKETGQHTTASSGNGTVPQEEQASTLININTATDTELRTLPGIGSGKAAAIIAYREQQGVFRSIEEIQKVEGIKNGVYQKLKDKITVS